MRSYMAMTERRAAGGRVAFSWTIRRIDAVCGPSLGYLWLLGPYGCGCGLASILRMVFRLMPVSPTTCRRDTPSTKTRCLIFAHCATSRCIRGHLPNEEHRMRTGERRGMGHPRAPQGHVLELCFTRSVPHVARGSVPGVG